MTSGQGTESAERRDQIVDALYNSDSGFYGTPLDVAATYIVLFTIYGAVLDLSGAGRFFVELSAAAFRGSRTAAGRTAVASGFLLGTVSGSGAATTVSIGAVTWPMLRRAGYPVAVVQLSGDQPIARYMQFMHYVVFGLGYLRQMNFVTQPGVELSCIRGRGSLRDGWRVVRADVVGERRDLHGHAAEPGHRQRDALQAE